MYKVHFDKCTFENKGDWEWERERERARERERRDKLSHKLSHTEIVSKKEYREKDI